jgi:NADPH-dependent glutamate synthase beta subunit-like oxidoreductase
MDCAVQRSSSQCRLHRSFPSFTGSAAVGSGIAYIGGVDVVGERLALPNVRMKWCM